MGFPIRFVATVNKNDIVDRFLRSGDFRPNPELVLSWATAIDIQVNWTWQIA